jgi:hypothetical protein
MKTRFLAGTAAVAVLAAAPAAVHAAPTKVNVRVEGATKTLFEGNVVTDIRQVQGDASGPHKCDGTNGGASTTPGTTLTTAFSDAMRRGGIPWTGTWNASFEDFLIDSVGGEAATSTQFWGTALNFKDTEVGGCQQKVVEREQILVAFDSFGKRKLELVGPKGVRVGDPIRLRVVDGMAGEPVKGAKVGGKKTDSDGFAHPRATKRGVLRFKATASKSIRSNQIKVRVK